MVDVTHTAGYEIVVVDEYADVDSRVVHLTLDPSAFVLVAEAFGEYADSVREKIQTLEHVPNAFVDACIRAMKREEVCYEQVPVANPDRRLNHTDSSGTPCPLAPRALAILNGALTLRERW